MIKANLKEMIIRAEHRIRKNELKIKYAKDDEEKKFLEQQNEYERKIIDGLKEREAMY